MKRVIEAYQLVWYILPYGLLMLSVIVLALAGVLAPILLWSWNEPDFQPLWLLLYLLAPAYYVVLIRYGRWVNSVLNRAGIQ